MSEYISNLFDAGSLSPHGLCLLWRPELIWLHVVSDSIITIAYYSIPLVLIFFVRRRADLGFGWVFWCFALFITACGTTHLMAIWTLWRPDYAAEGLIKAATAAASIATAGALWPLLPVALKIPSPNQLKAINAHLARNVRERDAALAELEREMADREKVQAMLRQSQKMEALGQLTAGVAHDFNNLLSIVMLNIERVAREVPADGRASRAAQTSLEAARRAAQLTAQMLTYARPGAGGAQELDLSAFLRGFRRLAQDALGPQRAFEMTIPDQSCLVLVDGAELTGALLNLVVNARDATRRGDAVTIALTSPRGSDEAPEFTLRVSDTGHGMSPEVKARACDPFFTTKETGKGSGLGLSQVLGFARGAGGRVEIDSEEGRGTTVSLVLPRARSA
ncbi:MAG: ATP-binding protein [Alsobacter sp.]